MICAWVERTWTNGGLRLILGAKMSDYGSGRSDLRNMRQAFWLERPDLGSKRLDWGSESPSLWSERSNLGSQRPNLRLKGVI